MSYVVGGCSTYSKQLQRFPANYPPALVLGNGCHVRGTDNRTYIDLISALGAIFLGYQEPKVDQAVLRQLRVGTLFSLPHPEEEKVAEQLCRLTGWDQVRFCKNGSDATEAAVRLARFVTGRERIITFGGYHGFHSDVVTSTSGKGGGVVRTDTLLPLLPTDPDFLLRLAEAVSTAACVLAEPIGFSPLPWRHIKTMVGQAGCLLVFDEIISGLRYGPGSALPEVTPDLACYGKALGNGFPIACLAGPTSLMGELNEHVFFSGTGAAECLSLAAAGAVLDRLAADTELYGQMDTVGRLLQEGFNALAAQRGVDARCVGRPPRTQFRFATPGDFDRFRAAMADRGVLLGHDNFLSAAHTVPVIEKVVAACRSALAEQEE